ncbi:hypothetical protein Zmor_009802 [Zophobas morio]|uniref:Uncharacterized protein n=1 Tax=Zophobas morio TaxID=2755281 RepID=A0AA38IMD0_9CUCU|nr:hypothetical protein Zmor_009802 [Zophobas morio]
MAQLPCVRGRILELPSLSPPSPIDPVRPASLGEKPAVALIDVTVVLRNVSELSPFPVSNSGCINTKFTAGVVPAGFGTTFAILIAVSGTMRQLSVRSCVRH